MSTRFIVTSELRRCRSEPILKVHNEERIHLLGENSVQQKGRFIDI